MVRAKARVRKPKNPLVEDINISKLVKYSSRIKVNFNVPKNLFTRLDYLKNEKTSEWILHSEEGLLRLQSANKTTENAICVKLKRLMRDAESGKIRKLRMSFSSSWYGPFKVIKYYIDED